jgi:hypothetical protein
VQLDVAMGLSSDWWDVMWATAMAGLKLSPGLHFSLLSHITVDLGDGLRSQGMVDLLVGRSGGGP